jgi:phosphate-selective porin
MGHALFGALSLCACLGTTVAADEDSPKFGYKGGLFYESADRSMSLKINNRVQVRFTHEDPEMGDSFGSFRLRRWKFKMSGHVFDHWKYKLQVNFAGRGDRTVDVEDGEVDLGQTDVLEDAWFQYTKHPWYQPWVGQGKVFFGRERLTSSGKLQFVDRALLVGTAEVPRDIGVGLVGQSKNQRFEYQVGIYNGNALNQQKNDNDKFAYAGRVVWTPFGEYKLVEGALDRPESSVLAVGLDGYLNTSTSDAGEDLDVNVYGVEFAYKLHGFSAVAEYYLADQDTEGGGSEEADGGYAQVGYLFANNIEVAGRYATIDAQNETLFDDVDSKGIALNYYFKGHSYKIQADYRRIDDKTDDAEDVDVFRVQMQFAF